MWVEKKLVEIFNKKHYISTVEKTLDIIQKQRENPSNTILLQKLWIKLLKIMKSNPSIIKTKDNIKKVTLVDFPQASTKEVNLLIKPLNPKKATGPDGIPKSNLLL